MSYELNENDINEIINDSPIQIENSDVIVPLNDIFDERIEDNTEETDNTNNNTDNTTDGEINTENSIDTTQEDSNHINLLPEESHDETLRFSGAYWFDKIKEQVIICGGCGGIMSNAIFQIAKLQPKYMYLYDDDVVEMHNLAGQMFNSADVGKFKVDVMATKLVQYSNNYSVSALTQKYTESSHVANIMICGFDNMEARRLFFNKWKNNVASKKTTEDKAKCLFIDGRLSFDTLQIYTITGDDEYNINKYYRECLFSDNEADETICSMKQTTFMTCMIASLITNQFVNFCANEVMPMMKQLPFFIEYNSDTMYLKEE